MSDRNPSKQRRAAQNKAARQALANRTTKASQAPRPAADASSGTKGAGRAGAKPSRSAGRTTPAGRRGAVAAGNAGRPTRTGGAPVRRPTNPVSKVIADVQSVPGGKGIFFAFLFAVVASVMLFVSPTVPQVILKHVGESVAAFRKANDLKTPSGLPTKDLTRQVYAWSVLGPLTIAFAAVPVLIAGAGVVLTYKENRRRNFTILAFLMVAYFYLAGALAIFFIFSAAGLVYAAFKARQAEPPTPRAPRRSKAEDDDADDDEEYEDDDDEVDADAR